VDTGAGHRSTDKVALVSLRIIGDERGAVMHMLRADSPFFTRFGEVYFSEVRSGSVKAWKRHKQMTQRLAVPVGRVLFAVFDNREASLQPQVTEYELGRPDAYRLLVIPPMIWYGFQGISKEAAIIANCPDLPHDPDEMDRSDVFPGQGDFVWRDCANR